MDDVGLEAFDDARQTPGGGQVKLGSRGDGDEVEPFVGAPAELAVRVGDERRLMPERSQAVDGQQHLVLAASPGSGRVDVQGEHCAQCGVRGAGCGVRACADC